MPRQRPTFSGTDSQCTEEPIQYSWRDGSDSDSDPPSRRSMGLTKSCSSSEEISDSHSHTNRAGGSEAAAEESFASGLGRTERSDEPGCRVKDSLTQYEVQIGPNYSYQVHIDGNGRLHRLSEIHEDGRERRLSLQSLACENDAVPESPFSETDEDEPTTLRDYCGPGISAHGERSGDGHASPPSPQGYTARSDKARQDEYRTEEKQDEDEEKYVGRGRHSDYSENEDSYSDFWTELSADME